MTQTKAKLPLIGDYYGNPSKRYRFKGKVPTFSDLPEASGRIFNGDTYYVIDEDETYYFDEGEFKKVEISIEGGGGTSEPMVSITYSALKELRSNEELIAGMQYRITDYTCTTTQDETQSAGHVFDIIVTALDGKTLSEEAKAIQHEGDTYFADSNLAAWKLMYCLDNDTDKFGWADEANGKGVIYRMVDEWNNDVPYDFKNIMFKRYMIDECEKAPSLVGTYLRIPNKDGIVIDEDNWIWCYPFTFIESEGHGREVFDASIVANGTMLFEYMENVIGIKDNRRGVCSELNYGTGYKRMLDDGVVVISTYSKIMTN